ASQRLLHRGERLTEMLKQNQYDPLPIEKEVLIIFAANEGYFDKLAVSEVKPFERDLYAFFDARHKDLLDEVRTKREISDDLRKRLIAALDNFQTTRVPAGDAARAA
nr:F0F1 ATP synthase subunit alpha [Candidatus Binataceae bacterium]